MCGYTYIRVCVVVSKHVCAQTCTGVSGDLKWTSGSFLNGSSSYSLSLDLANLLSLYSQLVPGKLLSLSSQIKDKGTASQRLSALLWQLTR